MLDKHFREFAQLLIDTRIRFVVVGGYAVGFTGFRVTRISAVRTNGNGQGVSL
jgi:hypothetical protein